VAPDGKVLYFSQSRFERDICRGECCFVCGIGPGTRAFNNEHVLPKWMLRRYDLFRRTITAPNGSDHYYGRLTIPCCSDCNALMGRTIEEPVSALLRGGYDAVARRIGDGDVQWQLFTWLALLFVKMHLKDRAIRVELDTRKGSEVIADRYDWIALHHIYCVARSFFTGSALDPTVYGSMLLIQAKMGRHFEPFDFRDIHEAQSILLRVEDLALVCVLDDGGGSLNMFRTHLPRAGAMSPIQLRETLGHMSCLSMHLRNKPRFRTEIAAGQLAIRSTRDAAPYFDPIAPSELGSVVYGCCEDLLHAFRNDNINEIRERLLQGQWTFLKDRNGDFDPMSTEPLDVDASRSSAIDAPQDFDVHAFYEALDAQRRERNLTWKAVTAEVNRYRTRLRPIAQSTITGLKSKPGGEGDGMLQMLVWLGRTPESFVPGIPDADAPHYQLPQLARGEILRWDTGALFAALDRERQQRGWTWTAVARDIGGVTPNMLTNLATGPRTGFPRVMRLVLWLGEPAVTFTRIARW
jgi:hypothetical protein